MPKIVNYQTDLLRTFVTIIDLGAYTKAGDLLGRTQPAISLQIRRLEELVGAAVIKQIGRRLTLTREGEILLSYARDILRLNDELAFHFNRVKTAGVLRIGLPSDYAVNFLQAVLTEYARQHAEIALEIDCGWSTDILDKLRADELDLAVAMVNSEHPPYLSRSWLEQPIWVCAAGAAAQAKNSIALAVHPEGCVYRARMIQALDNAHMHWRIAYTSIGIHGLQNAVLNGLGISALTRHTLLPGMQVLGEADGLPPLDAIRIGLFYKHPRLSAAGIRLVNYIIGNLGDIKP